MIYNVKWDVTAYYDVQCTQLSQEAKKTTTLHMNATITAIL